VLIVNFGHCTYSHLIRPPRRLILWQRLSDERAGQIFENEQLGDNRPQRVGCEWGEWRLKPGVEWDDLG